MHPRKLIPWDTTALRNRAAFLLLMMLLLACRSGQNCKVLRISFVPKHTHFSKHLQGPLMMSVRKKKEPQGRRDEGGAQIWFARFEEGCQI